MDFREMEDLLDGFSRIPRLPVVQPTLMEIGGYPHYENVATNILAFFLDPEGNHGLGDLVLESLLTAAGETVPHSALEGTKVATQAYTGSKFLDLLVETDSLAVGIENKILAPVYNDLAEYGRFVRDRPGGRRQSVLILLALRRPDSSLDLAGFQPVTYEQLFDRVLRGIGLLLPKADGLYVSYLLDFIRTVQNLARRSEVPSAVREFITKNAGRLAEFQSQLEELKGEMRGRVRNLSELVSVGSHPSLYDVIGPGSYDGEWGPPRFALCRFWDIDVPNESKLAVDVYITPSGWKIVAFRRPESDISDLLAAKGVPSTSDDWYPVRRLCGTLVYDADPHKVAAEVQSLIDALRKRED